jgi:hypothetical protein
MGPNTLKLASQPLVTTDQLHVLSFLEFRTLGQVALLSKDVYLLAKRFFEAARTFVISGSVTITRQAADLSMALSLLRHSKKLRKLHLHDMGCSRSLLAPLRSLIAATIRRNADADSCGVGRVVVAEMSAGPRRSCHMLCLDQVSRLWAGYGLFNGTDKRLFNGT